MKLLANALLTVVFLGSRMSASITCDKDISLTGVGISTVLGAFQEVGQIYAANRSSLLGVKVSFSYDTVSSSYIWPRVLRTSSDNKTAIFTFTDAPSGIISELAPWVTIPLFAGCQGIIFNVPSVTSLNITFKVLADIFVGNITYWNDSEIQKYNPKLKLPGVPIVPVGRYEQSGDTHDFTTALSNYSPRWRDDYGVFDSPDFYGSICCNSSKWPAAVKLFGSRALGSIGIVGSIPYTIGYASSITATANNMSMASVDNRNGTLVYPNEKGAQAAMDYWVKVRPASKSDLSDALSSDAYPMVTSYHMSFINTSNSPIATDCCTARELLGFLLFLIGDNIQILVESKYFLVPISKVLKDRINATILHQMTCGDENLYDAYLATLIPKDNTATTITLFVGILAGVIAVGFMGVGLFYFRNRQKYLASISSWLISPDRLKSCKEAERPGFARSSISIQRSVMTDSSRCGSTEELALYLLGDQTVVATSIPSLDIRRMKLSTKRLLYQFHREFSHENILPFTGLVVAPPKHMSISCFSGRVTLHHLIHYSNYELSDDIRYNFASDVAQGMKFLHGRQIPHRLLSSLNCYVDRSWRVKVGHWHLSTLLQQENLRDLRLMLSYVGAPTERESLLRLLYLDPMAHKDTTFSHYADAYSFGLLLFELFAQMLPFESEVDLQIETFETVLQKKFLLLDLPKPEVPPNVPSAIRQLINNCLTDRTNRLHFKAIETGISHCRRSRKGIIDLLMDTMESYMADLEQKVAERTATMTELNAKLQSLLNEVLPAEIAMRLLRGEEVQPEHFDSVTIFFSDIVGFTTLSSQSTPMEVMSFLNDLWIVFDKTVEILDAYKIDTIGDAYMICSGLPRRNGFSHAKVIGNLAIALLEKTKSFTIRHRPNDQLRIRIGINSGPVTAGIVGSKMPQYCVFGDTVNTGALQIISPQKDSQHQLVVNLASRMESSGVPMKIQVAHNTFELLVKHYPNEFRLTYRGEAEVKVDLILLVEILNQFAGWMAFREKD